jgi:hypothetical protein
LLDDHGARAMHSQDVSRVMSGIDLVLERGGYLPKRRFHPR